MKIKKLLSVMTILAFLFVSIFGGLTYSPKPASAAVSSWQKGVSLVPKNTTDFASSNFQQSVRDAKSVGVNYVTLIIPLYQSNRFSSDIQNGWNTPTDSSLVSGINFAHSLGLKVNLKLHPEAYDIAWRAYIDPTDRSAWFANYTARMKNYSAIAQQNGAEMITIGAELISLTDPNINSQNTAYWTQLITEIKKIYSGFLTYSANWGESGFYEEVPDVKFWSQLNFVGVAAYYYLNNDQNNNSVTALKSGWDRWRTQKIEPIQTQTGKPILFTEVGYRSINGSHTFPWDYNVNTFHNQQEQANAYEALFSYWNNYSYMAGVHLWDWETDPNAGGNGNNNFTPQNKLAEQTMSTWFGTATPTPTPTPTPAPPPSAGCTQTGSGNFAACYFDNIDLTNLKVTRTDNQINFDWGGGSPDPSIGPDTFSARWQGNFNFNAADYAFNLTADDGIRLYIDNQLVLDKWINQPPTNYSVTKTMTLGSHNIRVDYFENGGGAVAKLSWTQLQPTPTPPPPPTPTPTPTPTPPPPPPTTANINIWWPGNNSSLSGVQPFKALLDNWNVSDYDLYWQVDGGQLNLMPSNNTDYPHKETLVNVGSWNWNGNGPYKINFVAKDKTGKVFAQKSITINIAR